ncbi:LytTr DNA-binding domain-containing protein [Spirosoma fluviale]|uniref:LytTr DNA-binding domain-containing protein n=2 Tax=Spirosoma fluviale TaxID=1597977 RepID=A0A286FAN3_9BACT|nr:LytTr DNA-binding domain-containing protein [Spirosoma fluviale]
MQRRHFFVTLSLLLPVFLSMAQSPESQNQVRVLLTDARQQPIFGATVQQRLWPDTTQTVTTISDTAGVALLPAKPDAAYQLRISAMGFKPVVQGIHLLTVDDITYLQADEGIVFAFDVRGQKYPLSGNLTELEDQLDPARFFRLNRSEIINIRYIDRLEPYFNDRLAVRMLGHTDPLITSTGRTPDLRRWLEG